MLPHPILHGNSIESIEEPKSIKLKVNRDRGLPVYNSSNLFNGLKNVESSSINSFINKGWRSNESCLGADILSVWRFIKDVQRSLLPPSSGLKTWIQVDTPVKTCEAKHSQVLEDKLL